MRALWLLLAGQAWAALLRHASANASLPAAPLASDLPTQQQHELHWLKSQVAQNRAELAHLAGAVDAWDVTPPPRALALTPECQAASCDACVEQDGCGWCAVAGECRRGTHNGPSGTTCLWEYGACSREARPCAQRHDCGSCVGDGTCGWCADTHTCEDGNPSGPIGTTCVGRDGHGVVNLWVHADGLRPTCPAPQSLGATDPVARQELGDVIAAAERRALQTPAPAGPAAPVTKPPCQLYATTPAPTTPMPTTVAPTLPPEQRTDIYFLPQTTLAPTAAPEDDFGNWAANGTAANGTLDAVDELAIPAADEAEAAPAEAAESAPEESLEAAANSTASEAAALLSLLRR